MQLQLHPKNTTKTIAGCGKLGDAAQEVVAGRCRSSYRHCQAGQPSHDQVMIMIVIMVTLVTSPSSSSSSPSGRRSLFSLRLVEKRFVGNLTKPNDIGPTPSSISSTHTYGWGWWWWRWWWWYENDDHDRAHPCSLYLQPTRVRIVNDHPDDDEDRINFFKHHDHDLSWWELQRR